MKVRISFAVTLTLGALALLMPATSAVKAQSIDDASVAQIIEEIRDHAALANEDAEVLSSYAQSNVSWQSHSIRLNQVRSHVNDLFEDYYRLQKIATNATTKQRDAIDRLEPLLREMAAALEGTIVDLSEHQNWANLPSFRARVRSEYSMINTVYRELCKCTGKNA